MRGGMSPAALQLASEGQSVLEVARELNQSPAYISLQLSGRRKMSEKLLDVISADVLSRVPDYERR